MPLQKLPVRSLPHMPGQNSQLLTVKFVIILPIFKFFFYSFAYFHMIFWCYSKIPAVKQPVHICSEQDAVVHPAGAAFGIGFYVAGFQGG